MTPKAVAKKWLRDKGRNQEEASEGEQEKERNQEEAGEEWEWEKERSQEETS